MMTKWETAESTINPRMEAEDAVCNVLQALECIKTTTDQGHRRIAKGVWDQVAIALTEGQRALVFLRSRGWPTPQEQTRLLAAWGIIERLDGTCQHPLSEAGCISCESRSLIRDHLHDLHSPPQARA